MNMKNVHAVIETLTNVAEINTDRINNYKNILSKTDRINEDIKQLYTDRIAESIQFKEELEAEVEILSMDIFVDIPAKNRLYNTWIKLKEIFAGNNKKDIQRECELAEVAIKKAYEIAIEYDSTPSYIRQMLNDQYITLLSTNKKIKKLQRNLNQVKISA